MDDLNRPATVGDVREAEERIAADIRSAVQESEERMQEFMRGLQTELLRGFSSFVQGANIRFRKIESDVSNGDAASTLRMANLEERLSNIELKVWGQPPAPPAN